MTTAKSEGWWQVRDASRGGSLGWRIGPLRLRARRRPGEWRIAYDWAATNTTGWERVENPGDLADDNAKVERHVVADAPPELELAPALADRPVVSAPRLPLFLAPGQEVTLYVGSPLWVRLTLPAIGLSLRELPVRRPSDSWFGASTRDGEACYATRTRAILNRAAVGPSVEWALTPVTVRNEAAAPFALERLKLPVPWLSIFGGAEGGLWTEEVRMTREEESGLARVDILPGPPAGAGKAESRTPPREEHEHRSLARVFSTLFSG